MTTSTHFTLTHTHTQTCTLHMPQTHAHYTHTHACTPHTHTLHTRTHAHTKGVAYDKKPALHYGTKTPSYSHSLLPGDRSTQDQTIASPSSGVCPTITLSEPASSLNTPGHIQHTPGATEKEPTPSLAKG